jgi:hypothetical protein
MRKMILKYSPLAAATIAAVLLLSFSVMMLSPRASRAVALTELGPVFLDPLDLGPGQIFRVRVDNLFGSQEAHARIELRNADDSSLIGVLFDGFLQPGRGASGELPFSSLLPAVQRAGHAGIIAVVQFMPVPGATGLPSDFESKTAISAQVADASTQRVMAVALERHQITPVRPSDLKQ